MLAALLFRLHEITSPCPPSAATYMYIGVILSVSIFGLTFFYVMSQWSWLTITHGTHSILSTSLSLPQLLHLLQLQPTVC